MKEREAKIRNYIEGYNQFDVDKMVAQFHENIVFKNIQNGETTMTLSGLGAFRQQAEQAKQYFSEREQTITAFRHGEAETEIDIDYRAVLAIDLPNGMKKGQEMRLSGKSIFEFSGDEIIGLTDVS